MHFKLRHSVALAALACAGFGFVPSADAKTFKWANSGDVSSMDPYARQETFLLTFNSNIYDPLIRRDKDLKLEPALQPVIFLNSDEEIGSPESTRTVATVVSIPRPFRPPLARKPGVCLIGSVCRQSLSRPLFFPGPQGRLFDPSSARLASS
jgi:hypothetical protein